MTNKPMLSVERELLAVVEGFITSQADAFPLINVPRGLRSEGLDQVSKELRALLDKEVDGDSHAPKQQGEPVELDERVLYDAWRGSNLGYVRPFNKYEWSAWKARARIAEQHAPVADHTQCEECKVWGYHENHHEGGGTECGDCGGSGNAPVALVMPERYSPAMYQMISGFESVTPEQFDLVWSACRSEVARLNGVKP